MKERVVILVVVLVGFLLLALGNPNSDNWWLKCPLFQLTHWQCPLCGSQRALHAFFHGEWSEAWHYNPVLWILSPYAGVWMYAILFPSASSLPWVKVVRSDRMLVFVIVLLLIWSVFRNLI